LVQLRRACFLQQFRVGFAQQEVDLWFEFRFLQIQIVELPQRCDVFLLVVQDCLGIGGVRITSPRDFDDVLRALCRAVVGFCDDCYVIAFLEFDLFYAPLLVFDSGLAAEKLVIAVTADEFCRGNLLVNDVLFLDGGSAVCVTPVFDGQVEFLFESASGVTRKSIVDPSTKLVLTASSCVTN
jgi:hypothetical protein